MIEVIKNLVQSVWTKEPAVVLSTLAGAVLFVASQLGIVIPETDVLTGLAYVVPILLAAVGIRSQVTPE